jgi:predicted Zn-ribbon and HTH transcriptional regulator
MGGDIGSLSNSRRLDRRLYRLPGRQTAGLWIKIMLTELMKLLENKESGLSLAEISRSMNAQPSAILSMIEMLVQKGRLLEIGPDGKHCTSCGVQSDCNLLKARGKRYVVASHAQTFRNVSMI